MSTPMYRSTDAMTWRIEPRNGVGLPRCPSASVYHTPGPPGFETLIALISTEREVPLKSERGSSNARPATVPDPVDAAQGPPSALAGWRDLVADVDRPTYGRGRAGVVESARQTDLEVGIEERERVPVGPLDRVVDLPALVQGRRIVGLLARGDEHVALDAGAVGNTPGAEARGGIGGCG